MTPCVMQVLYMLKKLTWKDILRQQIKNEHGFGWNVSEQSEKTKVVRRYEDDSRSTVMLPIEWRASNAREIADSILTIVLQEKLQEIFFVLQEKLIGMLQEFHLQKFALPVPLS